MALLVAAMLGGAGLLMMAVRRLWRGYDIGLTAGTAVGGLLSYAAYRFPARACSPPRCTPSC